MTDVYLKIIFFKKLSKYIPDNVFIASAYEQLFKNYSDRQRVFHDIKHVTYLLKMLEFYAPKIDNYDVLYFTIWYHKSVFYSWKNDNTERSAHLANEILTAAHFPEKDTDKVVQYITAAKDGISDGSNDLNYFLDFDLSVYALDPAVYKVYVQQLRAEWSFYHYFSLRARRKLFLSSLLEKEFIYNTALFRKNSENAARENIRFELESY